MTEESAIQDHHLSFLISSIPTLIDRSQSLTFDALNRLDLYAVMLYASIVELSSGACRLISIGEPTGSRALTRSVLEALVDLTNLHSDEKYVKHLNANSLKEWLKTYQVAEDGNEFFSLLADQSELTDRIAAETAELEELQEQGFGPLNAFDRFRRAGMVDIYKSVYHWLCSDSHNSLRAMTRRHLNVSDDGAVSLHILMPTTIDDHLHILDALAGFLISASQLIHTSYGSGPEAVKDLSDSLDELRQQWHAANNEQVTE